jgi:anaphase-promoting complex subunit 1
MFIAERTLALAFGRAALTIGSISSINTNIHPIPKIEYSVKILPDNTTLVMDLQKLPLESRQWGDFHNGVAAALRIDTSAQGVDSAWIKFNKPAELTAEHAGFLFGLGLNGHLRTMVDWHAYQYLTPKHEFTSVALLLGLSATYLGTGDPDVTRILSIHTPPLLPKNSADLNIPLAAQTAGLMGIGLLYLGTQSRKMADMALGEISRRRGGGPELSNEHLEAYAITAGLAFGMIMCGHGGRTNSPVELQMLATLRTLILGEPAPVANKEPAKPKFDINVTSPAATVALALMYLKSNRQDVAALLDIPQTPLGLSLVQPNFLLLRVMGRGLIMWDEMKPREEWVMKQVPVFTEDELAKKSVKDSHDLAWVQIVSGACMAIGLKYAGSANIDAYTTLVNFLELLAKRNVPGNVLFSFSTHQS